MSELDNKQAQPANAKSKARPPKNPFEGSALFSSPAAPALPELTGTPAQQETSAAPKPSVNAATSSTDQPPLLYTSKPTAQFRLRPFEQQHDRQTIYIDAYLAGAVDALVELVAGGNKTRLVNEMVRDLLRKHEQALRENEDLVRLTEEKYRKKHNL